MATLPTNRTTGVDAATHVADHNEIHRLHDILDGSTVNTATNTAAIVAEVARATAAEANKTSARINMKIKYGLHADNATDDTALIAAGIATEVAAAVADGTNYRDLFFPPGVYLVSGSLTQGGSTHGNALIPLPVIAATQQKVTLVLSGVADASATYHWLQTATQQSGTVFHTTVSTVVDGTFGEPSIIGGPTFAQGYGGSSGSPLFNNMLIVIDGISLLMPQDPHINGFDFKGMGQANVKTASCLVATGAALISSITYPTAGWQFGLGMPNVDNNDNCNIGIYSAQGMNYGVIASEHTTIVSMRAVYCVAGLVCAGGINTGTPHGMVIFYASCEACSIGVQFNYDTANPTKITIFMMDYEALGAPFGIFWAINDPANNGLGTIYVRDVPTAEMVNGGSQLRIYNEDAASGHKTAPAIPTSTVAFQNPFWRDAFVNIVGGTVTVIAVDGTATGLTSGSFMVPTGKNITLTYSVAPTWNWVCL